jgi:hypothetical protein
MADATCVIKDCEDPVQNRRHGWCNKHYKRWRRHNDPLVALRARRPRGMPPEEWFWTKVDKAGPVPEHRPELGPCWVRAGARHSNGYIKLDFDGKYDYAHRLAWVLAHGPVPDGLHVLHHCDTPPCVKAVADEYGPEHLFVGTAAENSADMIAKGRSGSAKITTEVARAIKDRSAAGMSRQQIADELGITVHIVKNVRAGRSWRQA